MSDVNQKCLDTFPTWLRSLAEDVEALLAAAATDGLDLDAKRQLVAGINYLFKSLDLIPDGIDDIGYLDDAFVLRVSASLVPQDTLAAASDDVRRALGRLAEQAPLVEEFLGAENYGRLQRYTKELCKSSARGRSVVEIVDADATWREFAAEVRSFARTYESPSFAREEKNLIKLRAFFDAKLPR
jgi:uncharacterized membrane protein YkvA (DUF1232 family)